MIPDGLPAIGQGSHQPGQGQACAMEYVALLAGEEWTDSPECTDTLVAQVARMVNDRLSEENRSRLIAPRVGHLLVARPLDGRAETDFLLLVLGHTRAWAEKVVTNPVTAFRLGCDVGSVDMVEYHEGNHRRLKPVRQSLINMVTHVIDVLAEGEVGDDDLIGMLDLILSAHLSACRRVDRDNKSTAIPDEEQVLAMMLDAHASITA